MAKLTIVRDDDDRARTRIRGVSLRLDGVAWLRITAAELAELSLQEGDEIDEEARARINERLLRTRSRGFVTRSLAVRAQSVAEIARKLEARSIPQEIATETIELARSYGFLDDVTLAGQLARGLHAKRYGRFRAEQVLRRRGLPTEVAAEALDDAYGDTDEPVLARQALGKRHPPESDTERRRAVSYLVRRGFSSSAAWAAVKGDEGASGSSSSRWSS